MRIESAQINAKVKHEYVQQSVDRESLNFWGGQRGPATSLTPSAVRATPSIADTLSLSPKAQASLPVRMETPIDGNSQELSPKDQLMVDILRLMFKALTGEDPQVFSPKELGEKIAQAQEQAGAAGAQVQGAQAAQNVPTLPAGYGLAYDHYQSYYESESTSFSADGIIKTSDGQEIQFSVEINMSREFYIEHSDSLRLGDAKKVDPLVVNFAGNAADLGDTRFQFDIDADGRAEQLALLKPGSGLLALDKNGDGRINNGSELFGAQTGNGFGELAAFDEDKNGFLDSGDSIYDKLRIWIHDEQGNKQLAGLGAKGIGAIYLGHLASPFTFKDAANTTQGDVASTGLFIRDNGSAGTIQQINYAV